ncbi:MAG TPA: hypothetical protein VF088_18760 [Pyrinomonadaceae bacterium]
MRMGRYCKAYSLNRLREFSEWTAKAQNVVRENNPDEKKLDVDRESSEDIYLYLQENYTVTDGIFIDENIVFDSVTPEWKNFCQQTLKFETPEFPVDEPA